jgi:hypothetical protein
LCSVISTSSDLLPGDSYDSEEDERWTGHTAYLRVKFVLRILVREPEEKSLLGFCKYRQGNENEMDVNEIGFLDMDWIHLVIGRLHSQVLVTTARYR